MRKWHRWLSLFFGIFMLWMGVTGLIIHTNQIIGSGGGKPASAATSPGAPPGASHPGGFVCPPDYMCRPRSRPGHLPFPVLIQHLHSGEALGPIGRAVSFISGLALVFFSVSGIWMYIQMWKFRQRRNLAPRWLWR